MTFVEPVRSGAKALECVTGDRKSPHATTR